MREFTARELHAYLESASPKPLLLDVREPWEFETARIEGATLVPMRSVPTRAQDFDRQQEIVVICHHGVRSSMVGLFLENQGFIKIINLTSGVEPAARDIDQHKAT